MSTRPGIPQLDRYHRAPSTGRGAESATRPARFLHPGQILVATRPTVITTILGSCVSVCLFDPRRCIGGINHFMLPNWAGRGQASARFGNIAMDRLLEEMIAAGSRSSELTARLFGGSHLLRGVEPGAGSTAALGARNVEVARTMLERARITVLTAEVGGDHGRKLTFVSDDGSVVVRTLRASSRAAHR